MPSRRSFVLGTLAAAVGSSVKAGPPTEKPFQYERLRWMDEREDPSATIETEELVAKVIDNTGLRPRPGSWWMEQNYSHHLGYHGIRALWRKDEKRNVVSPFFSWLSLQGLRVDGLDLDPVDWRARAGVGRGWPMQLDRQAEEVVLRIPRMPVSGIAYELRVGPASSDSIDFAIRFTLHEKRKEKATFSASWACYMSTYDEVQLHAPTGSGLRPSWEAFGETETWVLGDPVNYQHSQRRFAPQTPPAFPAVYGRIGSNVLAIMASRPEVSFFLFNAGGHIAYLPVQNPAWDFSLYLPDYEPSVPFGFRGRLTYKAWAGADEITDRYREWQDELRG